MHSSITLKVRPLTGERGLWIRRAQLNVLERKKLPALEFISSWEHIVKRSAPATTGEAHPG